MLLERLACGGATPFSSFTNWREFHKTFRILLRGDFQEGIVLARVGARSIVVFLPKPIAFFAIVKHPIPVLVEAKAYQYRKLFRSGPSRVSVLRARFGRFVRFRGKRSSVFQRSSHPVSRERFSAR